MANQNLTLLTLNVICGHLENKSCKLVSIGGKIYLDLCRRPLNFKSVTMSTLTQRHTGIVQRKKTKEGAEGGANDPDVDNNFEDEEEDRDSKETRLTLMEEILLLGLKDREVHILLYNKLFFVHT